MKSQVQRYHQSDVKNRTVVAETDQPMTPNASQQWLEQTRQKLEIPLREGEQLFVAAENTEWFIRPKNEPQQAVLPSQAGVKDSGQSKKETTPAAKPVRFADVAKVELQLSRKRQLQKQQEQDRINAGLAKLAQGN